MVVAKIVLCGLEQVHVWKDTENDGGQAQIQLAQCKTFIDEPMSAFNDFTKHGTDDLLHAQTRPATLGESQHPALDALVALVVLVQPPLWDERIRVWEYGLIVMRDGC